MTAQPSLTSKLVAEFVGTFTLIAAGLGVFVSTQGAPDLVAVAFAHGLAIAVMVTAIGHISGGHLNPAITVSIMLFRKINPLHGLAYIAVQLLGAYVAALAMMVGFGLKASELKGSVPAVAEGLDPSRGMLLEAIATFFLVWVVYAVAIDRDGAFFKVAGMPIGFSIVMGIMMIGPSTGGALNPARWFGPALLTGQWANAWVYIVGPIAGGIVAGALYLYGVRPRLVDPAIIPQP